jgi:hypothetical protein
MLSAAIALGGQRTTESDAAASLFADIAGHAPTANIHRTAIPLRRSIW